MKQCNYDFFFPLWNSANRLIWNHLCVYELVAAGDCLNIVLFFSLSFIFKSWSHLIDGRQDQQIVWSAAICIWASSVCVCVCVCVGLSVETIHRLILHFFLQMYSSTIISCRENRAEPCYYKQKCMVLLLLASSVLFFPAKQRTRFSSTDEVRGGNIRR